MGKVHNPRQGANFQSSVGKKILTCLGIELRQFTNRVVRCPLSGRTRTKLCDLWDPFQSEAPWSYVTSTSGLCNAQPPWPHTTHQRLSLAENNVWINTLFVPFHLCRPSICHERAGAS